MPGAQKPGLSAASHHAAQGPAPKLRQLFPVIEHEPDTTIYNNPLMKANVMACPLLLSLLQTPLYLPSGY